MVKYSEAYVNNNLIHAGIAEKRLMRVHIECLVTKDERQEDKCMFGTLSRMLWSIIKMEGIKARTGWRK